MKKGALLLVTSKNPEHTEHEKRENPQGNKLFVATLAGEKANRDSSKGAVDAHSHYSTGSIRDNRASENSASAGGGVPA